MLKNLKLNLICQNNKNQLIYPSKEFQPSSCLIYNSSKKNYNGLFERPTQNLFSNLVILSSIQSIEHFKYSYDISWSLSIALMSTGIRLLQIPSLWLIKDINFQKYFPRTVNNFVNRWYHKLIINDLEIDIKRNRINKIEGEKLLKYYNTNMIISYFSQLILLFNYFRGLNSMCKASNSTLYPNFTNDLLGLNLATYDSYFIFPIIVFLNNFLLIKVVNHPYLINFNLNDKKLLSLAFLTSLFSVFWPKCYSICWVSYCITHIIITKFTNYISERQNNKRDYSKYVERKYKNEIDELYKKY